MIASPHLLRAVAVSSVAALLVGWMVTVDPLAAPADAATQLPADAETFLVSGTDSGASTDPYVTPDGQKVAFVSTADDLGTIDTNGIAHIFLSTAIQGKDDPFTGTAELVSAPDPFFAVEAANDASTQPAMSADGRYVVFTSEATNLVTEASAPNVRQVYVRDMQLGTTVRLEGAGVPDGPSYDADISDDGRFVVFTSDATNLPAGDVNSVPDTNGAADTFIADLDPDRNGHHDSVAITRLLQDLSLPGGTAQARISGNGAYVLFTARVDLIEFGQPIGSFTRPHLFRADLGARSDAFRVATGAHDGAIDATGDVVAYIDDSLCGDPSVMAASIANNGLAFQVAVGRPGSITDVGEVFAPAISADGQLVAFPTTQPVFAGNANLPALTRPVIRVQQVISWFDTGGDFLCAPNSGLWYDAIDGDAVSLSASGRTIVASGDSAQSAAAASVSAIDTHVHDGISVSNTLGSVLAPGFVTTIEIADIPLADLPDYSAALANAPIYRLPIYRLPIYRLPIYRLPIYRLMVDDAPIYRLPIYRLPIYRLPIYRLDIPGGWHELLQDTPFAELPEQNVTLSQVLQWAADTIANPPADNPKALPAAERIQTLALGDLDLTGSGLDSLSLASMILGAAPVVQLPSGDPTAAEKRWQDLVDAQGIQLDVNAETVLAELDSAGLDIGRSGVESVPLRDLAGLPTLLDTLPLKGLILGATPLGALDISTLDEATRVALFGAEATAGSLDFHVKALPEDANPTVADLAAGTPDSVTLGTLLFSMVDAESYPWEQIDPGSVDPRAIIGGTPGDNCANGNRCQAYTEFQFTFDPGPGEPTEFAAPIASVELPAGTTQEGPTLAGGSGPRDSWRDTSAYTGPEQHDGTLQRFPLADMPGGTVISFEMRYSVTANPAEKPISTGTLTSGDLTAEDSVANEVHDDITLLRRDNFNNNRVNGAWVGDPTTLREGLISYDMISPQWLDDQGAEGGLQIGPADDEDWYLVDPPTRDQRLIVSTNATDGQISMALYSADAAGTPLGAGDATDAPGTAITEQQSSAADDPGEAGADAAAPVAGHTLVDQAVVGGDGVAEVQTASTDAAAGQPLLVRVTSGNGVPTTGLYSIRANYVDEPPEQSCPDWSAPAQGKPGVVGTSDAVTTATNTVYLFDSKRYGDLYGADAATSVVDALHSMTGEGEVGAGTVQGAVLSLDSNSAVAAARAVLDANPCSMSARADLTEAINTYVKAAIGSQRSHISSIVIVGGDDVIPFAPVAQHTSQFNEAKHGAELKLPHPLAGGVCPQVVTGQDDLCATPLSSAAATNHILSDDPYGLAKAYRSLGGFLYVPTVAVGRLIDTPDQIIGAITRFNGADGVLAADSSVSGGYGAWSELPGIVTDELDWRDAARGTILSEPWTKANVDDAVFNATQSPRVVSINTHADEQLMLPGITGAEDGAAKPTDLLTAQGRTGKAALNGALVFMIGCHAGNNLPTSYYGDVADWADVFSSAGGYVGNTGWGLASNSATALSERLLGLYAGWVGAKVGTTKVSSAGALTYAKQSYLGGLGVYSGYDEKVLMEAVYYGLPMYAFSGPTQDAPLPTIPSGLSPIQPNADGVLTASLNLSNFRVTPGGDPAKGTYLTVNGQEPLAVEGQPVLPKVVSQLRAEQTGKTPRGALITGLTSTQEDTAKPAIAEASVGTGVEPGLPAGSAFPSSLATISSQLTPDGPVDLLVVTPARVEVGRDGAGKTEMFSSLDVEVLYGDDADTTAPIIKATEVDRDSTFRATVDGTGSDVTRVVLLIQRPGAPKWDPVELTSDDKVTWKSPPLGADPYRWILQAVDAGANVATESARGRIAVAHAPAPTKVEAGEDVGLRVGDRLLRTALVEGVDAATAITGSFTVTRADGSVVDSGIAVVNVGDDGKQHATIDHLISAIGSFTVELKVCSTGGCTRDTFALTVPPDNTAPTATARITSSTPLVLPTSTLTALITTADQDHDEVFMTPEWFRNGVAIPGSAYSTTLDLAAVGAAGGAVVPGEVIAVVVRTSDGEVSGTTARAEVVVGGLPDVPALPTITATATNDDGVYTEGWSRSAVTVAFTCTSGVAVFTCPASEHITADTKPEGTTIPGTVTDALGRTASTSILVKVDVTAPELHPTVDPATVPLNGPAPTADAGAADAASGIASQSCTAPDTSTAGIKQVTCTATDVAGNTAPDATASYTVTAPLPAAPTITASAKVGKAVYVEGTWSQGPTKVTFTCLSGVLVVQCSSPVTTSKDTGKAGVVVTGRVTDLLGRTATVQFVVQVDRTPPKLAPTVTPSTIPLGGTAVVKANATDALSGIASASCGALQTSTLGKKTVTCRATDAAGNTSTATANYSVVRPR